MKKILLTLTFLTVASLAQAATVVDTLTWTQPNDTIANVNTYVFSLTLDTAAPVQVTATCATAGVNVNCSTPITLTPGNHTITLTATDAAGSASGSLSYVAPPLPTTPGSVTVRIVITVP